MWQARKIRPRIGAAIAYARRTIFQQIRSRPGRPPQRESRKLESLLTGHPPAGAFGTSPLASGRSRLRGKLIEILRPPRHHPHALFEKLAAQIGGSDRAAPRPMRELRFDGVGIEQARLIQQRRCRRPESVAPERRIEGIFGHWPQRAAHAGEAKPPCPGRWPQFLEKQEASGAQRHKMRLTHFHFRGRDGP